MIGLTKLIVTFAANLTGLFIAAYFVPELQITNGPASVLSIALIISIVNLTIRPFIKLILSPLIFITFGIFTILINAFLLYFIDIFSASITISGLWPIIGASHIISLINIIINYAALYLYRGSDIS